MTLLPRASLLWWIGGCFVALSLAVAAAPASGSTCALAAGAVAAVAVLDAVLSLAAPRRLGAQLEDVIRLTKGRPGAITVRLSDPSKQGGRVRVGLSACESLGVDVPEMDVQMPADAPAATVEFQATPSVRGAYGLGPVLVGWRSWLGFFTVRRKVATGAEARVYPDLSADRRQVAGIFLTRGSWGLHAQRQVGQGHDFEQLREYVAGDSYGDIHWKATARRRQPVTKMFQFERTQEVYVVLDCSRLSARPSRPAGPDAPPVNSLERFISAGLLLGAVAQRQGDLFGVITYSQGVDRFRRATSGAPAYRSCREAMYDLQPQPVSPDYREVFSFIANRLHRRALLMFLCDLDEPILSESFAACVGLLTRKHLVLASMLGPAGVAPVFSRPADGVDDIYANLASHLRWAHLQETVKALARMGVHLSVLSHEKLCPRLIQQYLATKRRQLL